MLAHDGTPSMLLQRPGQMGPLWLKNRVVVARWGETSAPPARWPAANSIIAARKADIALSALLDVGNRGIGRKLPGAVI
jgi:hypothetical protein